MLKTWGLPLDVIHTKEIELSKTDAAAAAVVPSSKGIVNNVPAVQKQKMQRTVAFLNPSAVKTNSGLKKFISMDERRLRKPVGRVKDIVEIFEDRSVYTPFSHCFKLWGGTKLTDSLFF